MVWDTHNMREIKEHYRDQLVMGFTLMGWGRGYCAFENEELVLTLNTPCGPVKFKPGDRIEIPSDC